MSETQNTMQLQRKLGARHLNMIAIGGSYWYRSIPGLRGDHCQRWTRRCTTCICTDWDHDLFPDDQLG